MGRWRSSTPSTYRTERGDEVFLRFQEHYDRCDPDSTMSWGSGPPSASALEPPEVDRDRFTAPAFRGFPWVGTFTAAEYLDPLSSFSGHRYMRPEHRASLFAGVAGVIAEHCGRAQKHHVFTLTVSRRR